MKKSATPGVGEKKNVRSLSAEQVQVLFQSGLALQQQGRLDSARTIYQQLLAVFPTHSDAWHMLGVITAQSGDPIFALELISKAIEASPSNLSAYVSRGNLMLRLKRYQNAIDSYDRALAIKPDYAEMYFNRGIALYKFQQYFAAIDSFERAIAYAPQVAESYINRGLVLFDLKQYQTAIDSFDHAIAIKPDSADAHYNRGLALSELQRYPLAIESFDNAFDIAPGCEFLRGARLDIKMKICDWNGLDSEMAELLPKIERGEKVSFPFTVLSMTTSLPLQLKAAQTWAIHASSPDNLLGPISARIKGGRIRLGYFSADFHNHAVAQLLVELFELHNRDCFELIAFSFGPDANDDMRRRIVAAFDQFIDVRSQSDQEVARLSRSQKIDIAIDLSGFTRDNRAGILSYRAAPIQVSYLGYPGTMGVPYLDYLVADKILIPEQNQSHYSEKIVYLPNSYQANDRKRRISDKYLTRVELGLPPDGFVFCCFNNNYKITPSTFDGWMRILAQVDGSVLWLLEDNPWVASNLRQEAAKRGIHPDRLVFAPRMPLPEHLARHRQADLFLDTLPYNAHTTASDSLWAGLPVLTCTGESFASRVAASLLNAIGLPELVTSTPVGYETLAVELATDQDKLRAVREKLANNRLTMPLFDSPLFCRHIEAAYQEMHAKYLAGMPPDHIYVVETADVKL